MNGGYKIAQSLLVVAIQLKTTFILSLFTLRPLDMK